jgi:hypothetical protein
MPIVSSLLDGARRVFGAPVILAGATLLTLSLVLPVYGGLETGVPSAGVGESPVPLPGQWWRQCAAPTLGVTRAFETSLPGCAAQFVGLAVHAPAAHPLLAAYLLGGFLLLWTFLSGGILDRFARGRPTRAVGFFAACGLYGFRLVRLGLLAVVTYSVLLGPVQDVLFDRLLPWLAGNVSPTGQGAVRAALYVIFGTLLGFVGLVFDYARVRAVVEDRRSVVGALLAGWRFVRRRPLVCVGLYVANDSLVLAAVAVTPLLVMTQGASWLTLVAALIGLIARCAGRLLFYATEISYFQSQLAHAGYVAAPTPVWPESATADALGRLG